MPSPCQGMDHTQRCCPLGQPSSRKNSGFPKSIISSSDGFMTGIYVFAEPACSERPLWRLKVHCYHPEDIHLITTTLETPP